MNPQITITVSENDVKTLNKIRDKMTIKSSVSAIAATAFQDGLDKLAEIFDVKVNKKNK